MNDYTRDSERGHAEGVPKASRRNVSFPQGTRVTYVTLRQFLLLLLFIYYFLILSLTLFFFKSSSQLHDRIQLILYESVLYWCKVQHPFKYFHLTTILSSECKHNTATVCVCVIRCVQEYKLAADGRSCLLLADHCEGPKCQKQDSRFNDTLFSEMLRGYNNKTQQVILGQVFQMTFRWVFVEHALFLGCLGKLFHKRLFYFECNSQALEVHLQK